MDGRVVRISFGAPGLARGIARGRRAPCSARTRANATAELAEAIAATLTMLARFGG